MGTDMNTPESEHATWVARAEAFRADDPDPETQAELDALLARRDLDALRERFEQRLAFGTAGLRGLIGAGDNRMNRRVVAQTTAGLCAYLDALWPDAKERGLCLGWDGRRKSREFAEEVIAVACGAGFVVHAFETHGPTPLLAFSVLDRAAAGGVMITASHNPAAYNGYKVYLWDGAQLNEPHDAGIARASAAIGSVLQLPRLERQEASRRGWLKPLAGIEERYLEKLREQLALDGQAGGSATRAKESARAPRLDGQVSASPARVEESARQAPSAGPESGLRVAYTPLHGVGLPLAERALHAAGVHDLRVVAEQARPDPDFPTVQFPNPEEPGTLDCLLALAEASDAELAIANDPDADRLSLAVRNARGAFAALSGNEVGVLFADYLLALAPADGRNLIVSTIVSTPLIGRIAAAHGARWETTLTGFKWIVRRGLSLQAQGARFVLGFEEALGYCVGGLVHDKDGVAGAAHAACMARFHRARGRSLRQALEDVYRRYGLFESRQISIQLPGAAGLSAMRDWMRRLRAAPPERLAARAVLALTDLQMGTWLRGSERGVTQLPKSDVLVFEFEGEQRVTIRPSGTEPKLKIYLDGLGEIRAGETLEGAQGRVKAEADALEGAVRALAQASLA